MRGFITLTLVGGGVVAVNAANVSSFNRRDGVGTVLFMISGASIAVEESMQDVLDAIDRE